MAFFTAPRLFTTFALAAFILPAAANAAEIVPAQNFASVSTNGMDLTNPAARAMLTHRIVVVAHKLCGQMSTGDVLTSDAFDECVGRATADAKSQMDSRIAAASTRAMVTSIASK